MITLFVICYIGHFHALLTQDGDVPSPTMISLCSLDHSNNPNNPNNPNDMKDIKEKNKQLSNISVGSENKSSSCNSSINRLPVRFKHVLNISNPGSPGSLGEADDEYEDDSRLLRYYMNIHELPDDIWGVCLSDNDKHPLIPHLTKSSLNDQFMWEICPHSEQLMQKVGLFKKYHTEMWSSYLQNAYKVHKKWKKLSYLYHTQSNSLSPSLSHPTMNISSSVGSENEQKKKIISSGDNNPSNPDKEIETELKTSSRNNPTRGGEKDSHASRASGAPLSNNPNNSSNPSCSSFATPKAPGATLGNNPNNPNNSDRDSTGTVSGNASLSTSQSSALNILNSENSRQGSIYVDRPSSSRQLSDASMTSINNDNNLDHILKTEGEGSENSESEMDVSDDDSEDMRKALEMSMKK